MSSDDIRRQFLLAIGETYDEYGYPEYCGWVEGLLLMEPEEWTQQAISERLGEILPEPKHPTSVPSVNRALRLLEGYGIVHRSGSRRTGYTYQLLDSANMASSMLQQLAVVNDRFIERMKEIEKKSKDKQVTAAARAEIRMAKSWQSVLEQVLASFM